MTTREEAFEVVRAAHQDAADHLISDRAAAGADLNLVRQVNRNHKLLATALLDASSDLLDANNPGVDAACAAVTKACADVTKRRRDAENIANIISGVTDTVGAVNGLIKTLSA